MNSQNIRIVAYSTVGVLVLVLVGIIGFVYLSGKQSLSTQQAVKLNVGGVSSNDANSPFNVSVLNSGAYKALDKTLMDSGRLPVKVPENRGKANLFGI
jgi:hypothetical protein